MLVRPAVFVVLTCVAASLHAQAPSFTAAGVVNAASYAGGAVAAGELVTIFGSNVGPPVPAGLQLSADGQHASTLLGETRVLFDGVAAPLLYASGSQTTAVVPFRLAGTSSTQVQVEYQGALSSAVTLPVAAAAPGLFTAAASGRGPAAAANWPDGSLNDAAHAAPRGSIIIVYATAGGALAPALDDGAIARQAAPLQLPVTATIGGAAAGVPYVGAAPGMVAGVLQINLVVPDDAAIGEAVPLALTVGGARSAASVTVAVRAATEPPKLLSPYVLRANVYKGQMHAHSTRSDGTQDPATVVAAYRDAGYDFMALTDHDTPGPDPGVPGILFIPGMEQEPNGNHLNRINVTDIALGNEQNMIDTTLAKGGLVFLNHPNWPGGYPQNPNWTDAELLAVRNYCGIEVWNSIVTPNNNAEQRADFLLTQQRRFTLVGTDDCHDVRSSYCKTASTRVFADKLTAEDVLQALRQGNFYASNGGAILSISAGGPYFALTTDQPAKVDFLIDGGTLAYSAPSAFNAAYKTTGQETYIRARITYDSDKQMAWTNPIYVRRSSAETYPECRAP
jgi:uncharacterized protein (TIGR03437 family)